MDHLVLAGAAALFGLADIERAFSLLGVKVRFIEAPFMKHYRLVDERTEPLIDFATSLPVGVAALPLSEYWISRCLASPSSTVGDVALCASRSKRLFYQLLSPVCRVPRIFSGQQEALKFILQGGQVVVKPDGLFSGYGVHVVGQANAQRLEHHIYRAAHLVNHATRLFAVHNKGALLSERLEGIEGSADVFVWHGESHIVRVCRKVVRLVHGVPCTLVYQLIPPSCQVAQSLALWCAPLFGVRDVFFAQFDFIQTTQGDIVPIDFAARVAGGIAPLLRTWGDEARVNAYAQAIRSAAGEPPVYAREEDGLAWTQLNCLSCKSGRLRRDDYPLPEGKHFIHKRVGDFTPRCPSSAHSCVAQVVRRHAWPVDRSLLDSLVLSDDYIAPWQSLPRHTP